MTGPEHYREAEDWLESAGDKNSSDTEQAGFLAMAQIHATLALTAATAMARIGDMPYRDGDAWHVTAATMADPDGGEQ